MNLNEEITIKRDSRTSDGAGGFTATTSTVADLWGKVETLTGSLALEFQQLTGSKGYNVWIRTDFDREIKTKDKVVWSSIYGDKTLTINDMDIGKNFTKLVCQDDKT
jgi:SPP1 family predicted phage head-tail adaptor